MFSFPGPTPTH